MISVSSSDTRLNSTTSHIVFAVIVVLICSLPTGLNLLGFDFGAQTAAAVPAAQLDGFLQVLAGAMYHALLEWSAVTMAVLTALATCLHYVVRRDITVPVIGMALLSAGLVDAYHTLTTARLIDAQIDGGDISIVPFTWVISRSFHAGIMVLGVSVCYWITRSGVRHSHPGRLHIHGTVKLMVIGLFFLVIAGVVVYLGAESDVLPRTVAEHTLLSRPLGVAPLVLFAVGACLFWLWYKQDPTLARLALVLSVLPGMIAQLHIALGSRALFDNHFAIADFLDNVFYGTVFVGILTDLVSQIEEKSRQQMDAARQAEETSARIQAILNSAAEAIITLDARGKILSFNKSAVRIFGYSEAQVRGRSVDRLLPARYREKYGDTLSGYIRAGRIVTGRELELYGVRENGDEVPVTLSVSEVVVPGGRIYTGFIRDISQQKQLEKEREAALEQAQASARMKSEFLASMSHEIRTPMNGVLGMLSLLLRGELSEKQGQYARLARASAESLLSLLNDILDFSKVEAGKLALEILEFDLRSHLEACTEAMALRTQAKKLELVLDVTQLQQTMVRGDPSRLRQILTNLIDNAIKFTETGEIVVRATLEDVPVAGVAAKKVPANAAAESLRLRCAVTDTGIGIPPDKMNSLFDAFTQVDASTTRQFGGSGLGLAIVHQLCGLMGGDIHVASEVGGGSRFEFSVLLQSGEKAGEVLPQLDMRGARILIVDDNGASREVLRRQLSLWGAQVTEAKDGFAALGQLEQQVAAPFTAAIVDMQMPAMDGATLGGRIRADKRFAALPLIGTTAVGEQGDADVFAGLGFAGCIPKPVSTSDLLDALHTVLGSSQTVRVADPLATRRRRKPWRRAQRQTARILLVEDNAINQEVALGILDEMGFSADVAGNGLEAVAALIGAPSGAPFQLILMDCQMPEMDGYAATRHIRAGGCGAHNRDITIIAMTANAMKGDKDKCLAAGMNDYLAKPIDADALQACLQRWLAALAAVVPPAATTVPGGDSQPVSSPDFSPDSSPDTAPLWDRAAALQRVRGKESRLLYLIGSFLSEMPKSVARLQQAIDWGHRDEIAAIAHVINGVAGNLSGLQVKAVAEQIEAAARAADLVAVGRLWPEFTEQFQLLEARLEQEVRQVPGSRRGAGPAGAQLGPD
ncbi:response regulator [Exilibacterium tricleocarpae]|uniref:Sensory/regulatory protein RpfC n=1 Tax=Exilibacterium tricleocarpae TaxID=2591008 RepID=A0A545T1W5_9GAMM|nr:response regulator [Exilibacterium tricleocarpae]TQV71189.1 response regulator [Exilibacterium tricleocarpae]